MYGGSAQDHRWLRLRCKGAIGLSRGTAPRVASRKNTGCRLRWSIVARRTSRSRSGWGRGPLGGGRSVVCVCICIYIVGRHMRRHGDACAGNACRCRSCTCCGGRVRLADARVINPRERYREGAGDACVWRTHASLIPASGTTYVYVYIAYCVQFGVWAGTFAEDATSGSSWARAARRLRMPRGGVDRSRSQRRD